MKTNRALKITFWAALLLVFGVIALFMWGLFVEFPRGENRIGCIINIRNVQQAVRTYQAEHKLSAGDLLLMEDLMKEGLITGVSRCFNGNSYKTLDHVPEKGELYLRCSDPEDVPRGHEEW